VIALFKGHLQSAVPQRGPIEAGSPASTMQDIIILLLPYLGSTDAQALFKACLSREVIASEDSGVQKRGYKILGKLLDSGKVDDVDTEAAIKELDNMVDSLSAAAKKVTDHLYFFFLT
jgi:ribosomal RNA-processing protein 12